MYSTNVYVYLQKQTVVLVYGNSPRRYQNVYAKTLKLHRGVDNKIQFRFINQEQKPVDITNKEITMRVIGQDGTSVLIKKALTPTLPLTGLAEFRLMSSELEAIDAQKARYSLEIPLDSFDLPIFVDNDAGAQGHITIEDSVLPKHAPSMEVSIPSHASPLNNTVTYHSSVINTSYNPSLTLQVYYNNFSGMAIVQGSTVPNADWYNIISTSPVLSTTSTMGYSIEGYHPYVRIEFQSTQGNIDKVLAR